MASSPGEIHDALEASVETRRARQGFRGEHANPAPRDIALKRRALLAFLDEIEGDTSVCEVREALEDYRNG
jgi:hypothetical protein